MNKKEQLISDISEIKDGINSPTLEEKFKVGLREVLKKKESELASLKDEKPAEKKSAPAPAKKVSALAKKEDAKKSPKSVLDNCREILKKHNKDKATANKRVEKRKKQGKPATLTPSESVSKTAKSVSTKVVQMDKGLPASEVTKLANGIVATIKSTLKGITSTTAKHDFLNNIKKEISYLDGHLSKVAEYGGMFEDGGVVDKNGLIYALQNDVSAGTIAGQTYANTYDEVAEVRHNALEILYRDGDKPYSLDNLIQLLKKAEKVDNRSFARVGRSQYEVGGALDGLMGDINAPVQNVGGTLFSTADLTSHLDMNANPMFKDGGMMAKGGELSSSLKKRLENAKKRYGVNITKSQSLKAYEMHDIKYMGGSSVGYELFDALGYNPKSKRESQTLGDLAIDMGRYYKEMADGGMMADGGLADYYEKKKYSYKEGGLTDENTEMLMSQIKEIKHHAEEIENLINNNTSVEAWVVAKAERSATDLSDITHYIDGKKETFEDGGTIKWQDVNIGDSANVKAENKTGVIVHTYGRKFNLKFVDGTEKTYDASELEFFKDDEEMFEDGGRFNEGSAWTLDHYQHNKAESYEVPTKDRVYADGGVLESEINELYKKSNFINDDFNWKLKLLEMIQDRSIEAYNIYQTLTKKQKEEVLQEQFEVDNDMGSGGDGKMKSSRENLMYLLEDAKNGNKYADGGMMAKGGLTEHGLQIGDKIIGKSRIENNIQVMNDGKYALVDLDEGSRIEGIFEDGGGIKGIYEGSVRRINEKDYLIDESVLNKNGDIVGWNAYEVVYDEKMGEKHINYERTKKQHHKYFKNNISLLGKNVGSQYYSHGGETDEKKKELKEIINEDYETFVKLLGENIKDDKFRHTLKELSKDNLIKYRVINVECKKMIPTQNEISLDKSLAFPLTSPSDAEKYLKADHPIKIKNNTMLTCDNGKYIIDGHHRWSQVFVLNPNAIMSCTDFYQLKKPFSGLKATQLGISADLGYLPTSHVKDINLLTVSEKDLKKYVSDKITDEVKEVFKKYGINNPEEHIWKNVVLLKTHNKPVKNASKRDFMPQTDRAENFEKYTPNVSKLKKGGETTFADKVKSIAEKHLKRKKVSPSVQKDYGKTYNKEEALDSAKRIVGAMRKKEMSKKKVKINTDGYQNLDTIDFDKDADMVVDNA
jgi:hypothetical protein